jgi:hypothetical protein
MKARGADIGGKYLPLLAMVNGGPVHYHILPVSGPQPRGRKSNFLSHLCPSLEGAPSSQNQSTFQRILFLSDLLVSRDSRDVTTVANTKQKTQAAWRRWIEYSKYIILADTLLQDLPTGQKHRVIGCFAHAVREVRFSSQRI